MANSQFWIQNFELATAIIFKHFKETQDTHGRFNVCVCAENIKLWVFPFTFQVNTLPHTLNCICVSLYKFHI